MKKTNWVAIIIVIAVLVLAGYAIKKDIDRSLVTTVNQDQQLAGSAATSTPPDLTAGWNSYTSPNKYGFVIQYPSDFGFDTNIEHVRGLAYIPVCDENMLACVFMAKDRLPGTNFDGAGVSINMDSSLNTQAECYNFKVATNAAQTQTADVIINGEIFKSATGGDAATGHSEKVQVYRNFHNGKCYEISEHVGQTAIGNYPAGTVKPFDSDQVWQKLQGVVNTFTFTNKDFISAQQAIEIVSNRSDVQAYLNRVKANHGDPHVAVSDDGPVMSNEGDYFWFVHVYESFPDHDVTFGWYDVNAVTGSVSVKIP